MIVGASKEWAAAQVATLPKRWESRLLKRWNDQRQGVGYFAEVENEARANRELREVSSRLATIRIKLDATDKDICEAADTLAGRAFEMATIYRDEESLYQAMARIAKAQGVKPPAIDMCRDIPPALARMSDPLWWRRQLRKVHAKTVEGAAIQLGYVNRSRDPYVSNESVLRRAQQNERNAQSLESTIATNELGQEYTLAELAAKGPANKAIRRAELMTRISGFERIAIDLGHKGVFLTITCPSRMHKWTTSGGGVFENKRYDGTLPGQAQKHLAKTWAQIRAASARQGIKPYGFRIAEPNHDGTPHWHCLFFIEPAKMDAFIATVWKYALKDSPNEPGAHKHRVDVKPIDAGRGSAAGYIAKYVAKNIDGYRLDKDLIGNDAVETSHRVEAWASTWGIRQFQQVGGPPIGPWRELRRVESVPANAPQHLQDAHRAVNKITDLEAGEVKAVAWDRYVKAQGGVFCGRNYAVRVTMQEQEGFGKYGDPLTPKPVGVEAKQWETYTPAHMAWMGGKAERVIHWFIESVRHAWTITRKFSAESAKRFSPWTCVNNCTDTGQKESGEIGFPDPWPGGIPVYST